ncbi:MAG: amidohydrolase family protein, partial [Peptostreptococcaceae bacterium]|nr:amidohydrolase family protein [Peptostreptococcaceae bacterium]
MKKKDNNMNGYILIINGKCLSMVDEIMYDWVAIKGQAIHDLGYGEEYKKYVEQAVKIIDAMGATVLPGFIDSHFHVVQAAIDLKSLDLSQAQSYGDIGRLISFARDSFPRTPIRGIRLDEQQL